MARRIRLFQKKRGDRTTGSQRLGSYGEALFFGVFLVVGAIGLYLLLVEKILPEWRANRRFVEHECVVLDKRVGEVLREGRRTYRPEVLVGYRVGTLEHEVWTYDLHHDYAPRRSRAEAILDRFATGSPILCWYDPRDPQTVVLTRGYSWWYWLLLLVPASFLTAGAVGVGRALLQSGTSAERRAALAHRAARLELLSEEDGERHEFANVPSTENIRSSPGTNLAFRLPLDASPGWNVVGVGLLCGFWNGIVLFLLWTSVARLRGGEGSWVLLLSLIPFAVVGVFILRTVFKQARQALGQTATRLEISDHPLYPGESYQVYLAQAGRWKVNALEVSVLCEEEAVYRQGTDVRTESRCAWRQRIYRKTGFEITPGTTFADQCRVHIPPGAMHSFQSDHNEVKWKLLVEADMARWPNYRRAFSLVVYPPGGRGRQT